MNEFSKRLAGLSEERRALLIKELFSGSESHESMKFEPLAIIGMACRFPRSANLAAFWDLLDHGGDAISEVPAERWNVDEWYDSDALAPGKMITRWGGFLERVDEFDAGYFGISPREAVDMDPQQRLLLEVASEAIEHAGLPQQRVEGSKTGVFVGVSSSDYFLHSPPSVDSIGPYLGTGAAFSIVANRLSYLLDLRGTSVAVDTACSSSLVAFHLACKSLQDRDCELALVGGVNVVLSPVWNVAFSKFGFMSADGRCKTFDASADGYVRGEGCGIVVVKRLSDARAQGDNVLAVIRGSAVNQDGRTPGLTAPSVLAQQKVIQDALDRAGVSPSEISYVEAHGTGTPLGDPIELEALAEVFGQPSSEEHRVAIGSVKTNIGHLEAAAGIAQIIKVVLSLREESIPPHPHFRKLNPNISLENTSFVIPTEPLPWPARSDRRRYAGLSSFGFGGTNAHVVLEEAPREEEGEEAVREGVVSVLPLSARSPEALEALAKSYVGYLKSPSTAQVLLEELCYNASVRRSHHRHRVALLAHNRQELVARLEEWVEGRSGVGSGEAAAQPDKVVFVFSGQGSQWLQMGLALRDEPVYQEKLQECDELLRRYTDWSLLDELSVSEEGQSRLAQTQIAQPAICALQLALASLWRSWGIEPDAVIGHSVGEVAAAQVAGVLSLEEAMRVVYHRGRLMQQASGQGKMAAVGLSWEEAQDAVASYGDRLSVAACNSPHSAVLSGEARALAEVVQLLEPRGVFTRMLDVDYAFHSPQMEAYRSELVEALGGLEPRAAMLPIISTVTGRSCTQSDFGAEYWGRNIREPVRFARAIEYCVKAGYESFLEIGPHPVLGSAIRQSLEGLGVQGSVLASLHRQGEARATLLTALGVIYEEGHAVKWEGVYPRRRRHVPLPVYPWQRKRYWRGNTSGYWDGRRVSRNGATGRETQANDAEMEVAFYEMQWQPRSRLDQQLTRRSPEYMPSPEEISRLVQPEAERVKTQFNLDRYRELDVEMNRLSAAYARKALSDLGWQPVIGQCVTSDGLAAQLGVVDQHRRLFGRILEMQEEDGLLRGGDGQWEVVQVPPAEDPNLTLSLLESEVPECDAELTLFSQCGRNLGAVLAGGQNPLQLLFSSDSSTMLENLYRKSPFARSLNTLVEEAILQSLSKLPVHRPVKILEIGGGTGGATAQLLPNLPADRAEYLFTDVSEVFTHGAEQKFRQFPFVGYRVLDIEIDPQLQGFAPRQFDVILAANVLHATRDLQETAQNVHQLLVPGGIVVLLEGTRSQRWLDLIFGLTDGWWRFSDNKLRPKYPLMSGREWVNLLEQCGFRQAVALPEMTGREEVDQQVVPPQSVIIAQADAKDAVWPTAGPTAVPEKIVASWLVFADRDGVGERLAELLRTHGQECVLCFAGERFEQLDRDHFRVGPTRPEDVRRLLQLGWGDDRPAPRGIVHLWSLDVPVLDEIDEASLEEAQRLGCGNILEVLRESTQMAWTEKARLWLISRGAQSVGDQMELLGVAQSPLWGMGRGLAVELPELWGGLIDLDHHRSIEESAAVVLDELLHPDGEDQVAYRAGQRYVARLVHRPVAAGPARRLRWRADASYLISGGLGDLGLKVAQWMACQGAQRLVLISRSDFPSRAHWDAVPKEDPRAERIKAIRKLESLGAAVTVAPVDVGDRRQLQSLLHRLNEEGWPPFRGVIHCAGVAEAAPLLELTQEQLGRMFRAKVMGTWLLHDLLKNERLDFFVSFSSGAALLGSPMLGGYAAANAFLDAISHQRRATGQPALSVNWGFWDEAGMVARSQREIGLGFAPQGMQSFSVQQGLAAMQQLLEWDAIQTAVMPVQWEAWRSFQPRATQSLVLNNLLRGGTKHLEISSDGDKSTLNVQELLAEPAEKRPQLLQTYLSGQLGRVLHVPAADMDVHLPLNSLGVDSLMALELRNHVQTNLGQSIPIEQLLHDTTIAQLSQVLLDQLTQSTQASPPVTPASMSEDVQAEQGELVVGSGLDPELAEVALAKLGEMSDEEVDALLRKMLSGQENSKW